MKSSDFSYANPTDPLWRRALIGAVERTTGRERLRKLYLEQQRRDWESGGFFNTSIKALSLNLRYDVERVDRWPSQGPLLVVANHPFGVLDGIILCSLVQRVRPDFLALTNSILLRAPEMRERLLPIDFSENPAARRANATARTKAAAHLAGGGCLILFPAGAMATSPDRLGRAPAAELAWTPWLARLVQTARCPVAPVYFHGQNSRLFQIASHIHRNLRLALFFHEVKRRIGNTIRIEIGDVIPHADLAAVNDRAALAAELRRRTLALAQPRPR